jgi:hypothetical protein
MFLKLKLDVSTCCFLHDSTVFFNVTSASLKTRFMVANLKTRSIIAVFFNNRVGCALLNRSSKRRVYFCCYLEQIFVDNK